MRMIMVLVLALVPLLVSLDSQAQQRRYADGTVRVTLLDGSTVVGMIQSETDDEIVLRTDAGVQMTIPREQIRSIESLAGERFFRRDPNQSRLLFAPTGRPLEKGRGYVASYELFFPFVAYGPGGGFTLAGGFSLIPGSPAQLVYAAPKITMYQDRGTSVAVGVLAGTLIGDGDEDIPTVGVLYAVGTLGGSRAWLTGGLAFGFADGEVGDTPALMIGGEVQLSNSVKLMSENYILVNVDEGVLLSGGIRFFGDRLAADLAFITSPSLLSASDGWPFFPWLGFAYHFGN